MKKLVNICDVCNEIFAGGDAPKGRISQKRTKDYSVPIYSNGEENSGLYGFTDIARVSEPSITVSARGTIGYTAIRTEPFVPIVRLITLVPSQDDIDIKYLYYAVQNYKFSGTGTSIPQLTVPMLKQYSFPLPDKGVQQSIVRVLDKVSDMISLRKQQLTKLDELVKSRFIELFDDNVPTAKLGDVCQMINGDRGKNYPSGDDFVENGVPFVNAGHLQNRKVDFCDMNYITEEKFNLLSQGKMQEGDILYCLRGSLGKHGLVDFERGAVASSLVILRCNQEQVLPQFLLYALETPEIELQLKAANNGSSQPNLSAASVKAYDIKLPTIAQQKHFVSFVEQTDKSKLAIQQSLDKLELLKKALMQEYFG